MEKKVVELEVKDNVKSLRARLKEANIELQRVASEFGATSKEAVEASKKVAQLKDEMGDLADLTKAFNPDAKFNALSGSVSGVLNGFQAVEGGMALMGVESDKLAETMVRLQAVMNLSQGLQGLLEAKDTFKNLGAVVKDAYQGLLRYLGIKQSVNVAEAEGVAIQGEAVILENADTLATGANTTATVAQTTATNSATVATTALGVAMKALPILAIVGAVVALGSALASYFGKSEEASKEEEARKKKAEEQAQALDKVTSAVADEGAELVILLARLKNTNAGSKERSALINQINSQYGTTLKNLKDEKKFQDQASDALSRYIDELKKKVALQIVEDKLKALLKEQLDLEVKLNEERGKGNINNFIAKSGELKLQNDLVKGINNQSDAFSGLEANFTQMEQSRVAHAQAEGKRNQDAIDAMTRRNKVLTEQITALGGEAQRIIESLSSSFTLNTTTTNKNTTAVDENRDAEKRANDERERAIRVQKERNDLIERAEKLEEEYYESQLSAMDKELKASREKYFAIIDQAKTSNEEIQAEHDSNQKKLDEAYQKEIAKKGLTEAQKLVIEKNYNDMSLALMETLMAQTIDVEKLITIDIATQNSIRLKYQREAVEKNQELVEEQYQLGIEALEDSLFKDIVLITANYDKKLEKAHGNAELIKALEDAMQREIDEAKKKWREKDEKDTEASENTKAEVRQKKIEETLNSFSTLFQQIGEIADQEALDDEIRINKKYARELELAQGNAVLIAQIEKKKQKEIEAEQRKAFKIKKASDIAGAIIDGARAVTSTLAQYPKFDGGIAMYASLATTAVATGLAIAKISSTQFEGGAESGGGSMGSGITGGGVNAPSFNVVGATSGNQLAQLEQEPLRAYVVAGDVSSAQELERNRIMNATF